LLLSAAVLTFAVDVIILKLPVLLPVVQHVVAPGVTEAPHALTAHVGSASEVLLLSAGITTLTPFASLQFADTTAKHVASVALVLAFVLFPENAIGAPVESVQDVFATTAQVLSVVDVFAHNLFADSKISLPALDA